MDMFPKYSLLFAVQSGNPREVWGNLSSGWLGFCGPPKSIQFDEGGEQKHGIRADLCAERQVKLQFQGAGVHSWLLERRNGLARGIHNRLIEDDRLASGRILSEVQRRRALLAQYPHSNHPVFSVERGAAAAPLQEQAFVFFCAFRGSSEHLAYHLTGLNHKAVGRIFLALRAFREKHVELVGPSTTFGGNWQDVGTDEVDLAANCIGSEDAGIAEWELWGSVA